MSQRFEFCFRVSIIFIYVTHHTAAGLTLLPITVPVSGGNECYLSYYCEDLMDYIDWIDR